MTDLRAAAQKALEALENAEEDGNCEYGATAALRTALAQQQEQTCNCRWVGDVQTQQCTLHEAHVDAIHEWAERAKTAEAALAQQEQEQEPVALFTKYGPPTMRDRDFWSAGYAAGAARAIEAALKERNT
jgi:hypothetical protein